MGELTLDSYLKIVCQHSWNSNSNIIFYLEMKINKEDLNLAEIFSHQTTLRTLSEVFRQKDYNKIGNKLRNYQHLVLTLQAPLLSDIAHLQRIDTTLTHFTHLYTELQLTCDQIVDDIAALGFRNYSEMFDGLMQTINMMHEFMERTIKEGIHVQTSNVLKNDKASSNLCQLCHEIQQANHLKKLKTQFGLDYQLSEDFIEPSKPSEKEDEAIKQTQDFIEQLNGLLARKDKLINLPLNTYKLNALVDSLNKLSDFSDDICRSNERRKKTYRHTRIYGEGNSDQNEQLSQNHDKIVQEVRQILNSKFKEGYSMRIRTMLEKFEAALSEDKSLKVQKKTYINIRQAEAQTSSTPESVQIRVLTEELKRKEQELEGIKDNRNKMEQRFMKILENQRKIIKDLNASRHESVENEPRTRLFEQNKRQKEVTDRIKESNELSSTSNNTLTSQSYEVAPLPAHGSAISKAKNPPNLKISMSNKCIQTDPEPEEQLLESSNFDEEPAKELGKKKRIRRYSRAIINKFMLENLNLSKQTSLNQNQITIVCQVYTLSLTNRIEKTDRSLQVTPNSPEDYSKGDFLIMETKNANTNGRMVRKVEKNAQIKVGKSQKKQQKRQNKGPKNSLLKAKSKEQKVRQEEIFDDQLEQNGTLNKDSVAQPSQSSPYSFSNRNSSTQKLSRFAMPTFTVSEFSKTAKPEFTYTSKIRLTQVTPKKESYIMNPPKITNKSTAEDTDPHHITSRNNKQNKIIITKYQRKSSSSINKSKVREIVSLLRSQKKTETYKVRNSKVEDKLEQEQQSVTAKQEVLESNDEEIKEFQEDQQNQNESEKQDIIQSIRCAKAIIEAQYTYLKAAGFINYLFTLDTKAINPARRLSKSVFHFTHITEKEIELFGGIEEMMGYRCKKGKWKFILEEQVELKINCKNYNFASKISRYLSLLKKMNRRYYKEYVSFLLHPVDYCMAYFGHLEELQAKIKCISEDDNGNQEEIDEEVADGKEEELNLIIMRLINFHQKFHIDCGHVPAFLEKIGFYRYAI